MSHHNVKYTRFNDITQFFRKNNIDISNTFIEWDLNEKSPALLEIRYAIGNLVNIPGGVDILKDLTKYKLTNDSKADEYINTQCQYHNDLTTFAAVRLLNKKEKCTILGLESGRNKIISPNNPSMQRNLRNNKSCDLLVKMQRQDIYIEIKNHDAEVKNWGEKYFNKAYVDPQTNKRIPIGLNDPQNFMNWLPGQLKAAAEKGANYLIIRYPLWDGYNGISRKLNIEWLKDRLPGVTYVAGKGYLIKAPIDIPDYLKGIYIIYPRCNLIEKFTFLE